MANQDRKIVGYCANCGAPLEARDRFCIKCGTKAPEQKISVGSKVSEMIGEKQEAAAELIKKANPAADKIKTAIPAEKKKMAAIIAAGVVIVLAVIFGVVFHKPSVDLNKFMTIEESGYDGYGHARVFMDWDALNAKYGKKLKLSKEYEKKSIGIGYSYENSPIQEIRNNVECYLDQTRGLSNGDEINYTWDVDTEELKEALNCKIKFKDGSHKVSDLKSVISFDPFEDIEVSFSGVAPYGEADITYSGSEFDGYDFSCGNMRNLSEGDVITVTLDSRSAEQCAEDNGKKPEVLEKSYTVEGLGHFVMDAAELDQNSMDEMIRHGNDTFMASTQAWDHECVELLNFDYIGNYFLTNKTTDESEGFNYNILVYKGLTHNHYENGNHRYDQNIDFYYYVIYSNIIKNADGSMEINYDRMQTPEAYVTVDTGISSGWFSTKAWRYEGYHELSSLYRDLVAANEPKFSHFDNVNE